MELGPPPVNWHILFPETNVHYITEPPSAKFFDNADKFSLIVIDDLWSESTASLDIVKAFKVYNAQSSPPVLDFVL